MSEIDNICAEVFYENQEQLFPKQVVADIDEAIDFLRNAWLRCLMIRKNSLNI